MVCAAPPALFGGPDGNAAYSGDAALAAAAAAQATATAAAAAAAAAQADASSALALIATLSGTVDATFQLPRGLLFWSPPNTGTTLSTGGMGTGTVFGTVTLGRPTNTRLQTSRQFLGWTSVSGTNRVAGVSPNGPGGGVVFRGDTAGHGGFRFRATFGQTSTLANTTVWVGLSAIVGTFTDGNANVAVSALLNCIGIGYLAGSTNLDVISNDGSGAATSAANLGSLFPANDGVSVYTVTISALPNASTISYTVIRQNTGDTISGTVSSNIPVATTTMYPAAYSASTSTSGAVGFLLYDLTLETYSW